MKKSTLLFLIVMALAIALLAACQKTTAQPSTTPAPAATVSMTPAETALVAKWNLKVRETYNITLASTSYFNNPSNTYVQFAAQCDTNKTGSYIVSGYKCVEGSNVMVGMQNIWRACGDTIYSLGPNSNPNNLNTAFKYHTLYVSSDSLVFTNKTVSSQTSYNIWYFHK